MKQKHKKSPVDAGSVYDDYDTIYNPIFGVRNSLKARTQLVSAVLGLLDMPAKFSSLDLLSGKGETSQALHSLNPLINLSDLDNVDFKGRFAKSKFFERNAENLSNFENGCFNVVWLLHNSLSELAISEDLMDAAKFLDSYFKELARIGDVFVLELEYSFLGAPIEPIKVKIPKDYMYNLEGKAVKGIANVEQNHYVDSSRITWDVSINTGTNELKYNTLEVMHLPFSVVYPLLYKYFAVDLYYIKGKKLTHVEPHEVEAGYEPSIFVCKSLTKPTE